MDTETVKIEDLMDSDPEIEFIEKDSGMSSLGGSKDETPERRAVAAVSRGPKNVGSIPRSDPMFPLAHSVNLIVLT